MRYLTLALLFLSSRASSQCLWNVILQEFPNNTAIIGQDSVVFTAFENTTVSMSNSGSNFSVYINNTLQPGGFAAASPGQVIKIKPLTIGVEEIYVESNSCGTNQANFTVALNPLPITWSSNPTATIKNNQCQISWSVASQVNNSHFIIEHSTDGKSYSEIGKVEGHGNTSETIQYTNTHEIPSIGINYYRIKQEDYDGQSSYSDVVSVVYEPDGGDVSIYPNPASSDVTIEVFEPTEVVISDVLSKVLHKQTVNKENNVVEVSNFPNGFLIFKVGNQIQRIIKQ